MFYLFFIFLFVTPLFSRTIHEMSVEEKVGQLLMAHFNGEAVNDDAYILIEKGCLGGIIYYNWANELSSPLQVQKLSNGLQKIAQEKLGIPLLIAIDQEGGAVTRLTDGFTVFPGNKMLNLTKTPKLAELCAFAMGEEMRAVGINMNLAPVVDVKSNPNNLMGLARSFGNTPKIVVEFAKHSLKGYKKAKIITTLKHFPGLGDVTIDPHEDLPTLSKSKEELFNIELFPFIELHEQTDVIMTGHVIAFDLDPKNCATLSKEILQNLLRKKLSFQGIIISDSLVMEGVTKNSSSVAEATILAFEAGCDILLLGGKLLNGLSAGFELKVEDILNVHAALVNAVATGRISEERLNSSVERILLLKENHNLFQWNMPTPQDILDFVNTPAHRALSRAISDQ